MPDSIFRVMRCQNKFDLIRFDISDISRLYSYFFIDTSHNAKWHYVLLHRP